MRNKLFLGDNNRSREMIPNDYFHGIVEDPPYGLSFMGEKWDKKVPSTSFFEEQLRVLKPGAFLVCVSGDRFHHRVACNIEDAGFEIKRSIIWAYGSGLPYGRYIKDDRWDGYNTQLNVAFEFILVPLISRRALFLMT